MEGTFIPTSLRALRNSSDYRDHIISSVPEILNTRFMMGGMRFFQTVSAEMYVCHF